MAGAALPVKVTRTFLLHLLFMWHMRQFLQRHIKSAPSAFLVRWCWAAVRQSRRCCSSCAKEQRSCVGKQIACFDERKCALLCAYTTIIYTYYHCVVLTDNTGRLSVTRAQFENEVLIFDATQAQNDWRITLERKWWLKLFNIEAKRI